MTSKSTTIVDDIFTIAKTVILKREVLFLESSTVDSEENFRINYIERINNGDDLEDIIRDYNEQNNYLRMIAGYPPYGNSGVLYEGKYISRDFNKPDNISEIDLNYLISRGIIEELIVKYPEELYLHYIKSYVHPLTARNAKQFEPLIISSDLSGLFSEFNDILYQKVRYFRRWVINEFMARTYSYYEPMMCIMIILATCVELLARTSPLLLNTHLIKELDFYKIFKSYDLPFWDLPRSIREKFVDRIKLLIQSSSSKKVVADLTEIFGTIDVYKYLIYKSRIEGKVEINFVRVPYNEMNYEKYLGNTDYTYDYEDIVKQDKLWSLNNEETYLSEIQGQMFTVLNSKYMSVENMVDLSKSLMEMNLFFSFLLANDEFAKSKPLSYNGLDVTFFDFISYAASIVCLINGYEDTIPWNIDGYAYVSGLNTEADQGFIMNVINEYNEYIKSYEGREDDLIITDKTAYGKLKLTEDTEIMDALIVYNTVYDLLKFIEEKLKTCYDNEYFLLSKLYELIVKSKSLKYAFNDKLTYSSYLRSIGSNLYYRYLDFSRSGDKVLIGEEMELIINKLSDMAMSEGFLDNMFSGVRFNSQDIIRRALLDALRLFKSHTVDLLNMRTNYIIPEENIRFVDLIKTYSTINASEQIEHEDILPKKILHMDTTSFYDEFFKI